MEVLDGIVEGRDVIEMSFIADPNEEFAAQTQPGPFRAELNAGGVIVVFGR
jgi:hypothetical protein